MTDEAPKDLTTEDSSEQLRALILNIPGAVYRCADDWHRTMHFLSDAIQEITGYPASDFLKNHLRSYASVILPDDRPLVEQVIHEGVSRRTPYAIEYRIVHARGEVRWVHEKGQGMFDEGGQLVALHGTIMDITERKCLEQQLKQRAEDVVRSNKELLVRQRTMSSLLEDLQQAKEQIERQTQALQAANTKLKEAAVLKDEFVAKVSHELRTPLTSIKEGLSLVLDGALGDTTPEQRDFLKTMDGDIDRLTELINNILDISKIEAGRMRLLRTQLDLRGIIESLVRSYQPILGHRTVRILLTGVLPVFADANRMRQVFTNLFSNALKFTPDDGIITFRPESRDGLMGIAVEDNGPGIAAEDLPKLFQKFSQVGPQGGGQPRGTGLGLAVCKELTELHRGRIDVSSVVGRGTTFTVWLPVYTDAVALTENVRELLGGEPMEENLALWCIVMDALQCVETADGSTQRRAQLECLVEETRRRLHRDDRVLPWDPSLVVMLVVTDSNGVRAIAKRLRESMPEGDRLVFGAAMHSDDVTDPFALVQRAASAEGRAFLMSDSSMMPPQPEVRTTKSTS